MPFALYKPGQGKWSRGVGATGLAALGIWAAIETYGWMVAADLTGSRGWYSAYWVSGLLLALCLWAAYYVANRAGTTDFVIETETEMKKVTWPTSREVFGATVVVIIVVIVMGLFMFLVDRLLWQNVFEWIRILPRS